VELIRDGVNGWLFGEDLRTLMDLNDPAVIDINERDYREFRGKVEKILDLFNNDKEAFYQVALNAVNTMAPRVSIERVLREYYPSLLASSTP
jgi:starch phosphorylase